MIIQHGRLAGLFDGFHGPETRFRFMDGVVWRQAADREHGIYSYQPKARVIYQHGRCFLEVEGSDELVRVTRECGEKRVPDWGR